MKRQIEVLLGDGSILTVDLLASDFVSSIRDVTRDSTGNAAIDQKWTEHSDVKVTENLEYKIFIKVKQYSRSKRLAISDEKANTTTKAIMKSFAVEELTNNDLDKYINDELIEDVFNGLFNEEAKR